MQNLKVEYDFLSDLDVNESDKKAKIKQGFSSDFFLQNTACTK